MSINKILFSSLVMPTCITIDPDRNGLFAISQIPEFTCFQIHLIMCSKKKLTFGIDWSHGDVSVPLVVGFVTSGVSAGAHAGGK